MKQMKNKAAQIIGAALTGILMLKSGSMRQPARRRSFSDSDRDKSRDKDRI